ncbi:unnamed protein product, partial [Auanema sp. JU1783]
NVYMLIYLYTIILLTDCTLVERTTRYGILHGTRIVADHTEAEVFSSIPFAEPPIGNLRFESPKALAADDKRVINTTEVYSCIQSFLLDGFSSSIHQSEDCLYMKVITPVRRQNDSKYPAVIWIHGGSYSVGLNDMYQNENVIRHFTSKGIVFIAPNYRLNILGFMSMGESDFAGNYGLEDILCAAEMIKSLADDFNLDMERLTIAGESAGAALASLLSISPRAQNMFSSTILISGSSQNIWAIRESSTIATTALCALHCRCAKSSALQMKECLKTKDLDCLSSYQKYLLIPNQDTWLEPLRMGSALFTPVVDNYRQNLSLLPEPPEVLISKYGRGPILISVTTDEGKNIRILNNLIEYTCGNVQTCTSDRLKLLINSLISSNPQAIQELSPFIFEKYFQSFITLSDNSTILEISNMLTRDMTSSVYHEALLYSLNNISVYTLENEVHSSEPTAHGHDTSSLFGSDLFHSGCDNCRERTQFASKFAEILTTFIKMKQISDFQPFNSLNRIAHKLNENGITVIDWHTEDYYFWWQTIRLIQKNVYRKLVMT